jgi:hypothetical protein
MPHDGYDLGHPERHWRLRNEYQSCVNGVDTPPSETGMCAEIYGLSGNGIICGVAVRVVMEISRNFYHPER